MKTGKTLLSLLAVVLASCILTVCLTSCKRQKQAASEPSEDPAVSATAPEPSENNKTPVDYDNGVVRAPYTVDQVLLENDFSKELDPGCTKEYQKSAYYGCEASLEDGWLHLTSSEHLFVFGSHTWGAYGGIRFEVGKTYTFPLI